MRPYTRHFLRTKMIRQQNAIDVKSISFEEMEFDVHSEQDEKLKINSGENMGHNSSSNQDSASIEKINDNTPVKQNLMMRNRRGIGNR